MTKIKLGNAIVCEFIVQGLHGKVTLINNYSGDIFVSNVPAQMPLAFYVELFSDQTETRNGNISLYLNKKKIANMEASFVFVDSQPNVVLSPTAFITIDEPCTLKMVINVDGLKPVTAITKLIKVNEALLNATN